MTTHSEIHDDLSFEDSYNFAYLDEQTKRMIRRLARAVPSSVAFVEP